MTYNNSPYGGLEKTLFKEDNDWFTTTKPSGWMHEGRKSDPFHSTFDDRGIFQHQTYRYPGGVEYRYP